MVVVMVVVWWRIRPPSWVGLWPAAAVRRTRGLGSGDGSRRRLGRRTILGVPVAPGVVSPTPTGSRSVNRRRIRLRNGSQGPLHPSEKLCSKTIQLTSTDQVSSRGTCRSTRQRLIVTSPLTFVLKIGFLHYFISV